MPDHPHSEGFLQNITRFSPAHGTAPGRRMVWTEEERPAQPLEPGTCRDLLGKCERCSLHRSGTRNRTYDPLDRNERKEARTGPDLLRRRGMAAEAAAPIGARLRSIVRR